MSVDVAGEHHGELGSGFASPDQPIGCLTPELHDGWCYKFLFAPQSTRFGAGRPGWGEEYGPGIIALPQTDGPTLICGHLS